MFSNLFSKPVDFLAIGDITTDAFIRIKEASVHCTINNTRCEICMKFADKIPYESVTILRGVGNSANAAVAASRLGLTSAFMGNVGDDQNGRECIAELEKNGVNTKFVRTHPGKETNYHYVLWYEAERTILVKHQDYDYKVPSNLTIPKWIYLSSLGANSEQYHYALATWLDAHPQAKLAFQPGTFQMKLGVEKLAKLYARSEVFVVNVEEAQKILSLETRDLPTLLRGIAALGPKIICITDGPQGAYMLDTRKSAEATSGPYFMPIYPDQVPPYERTGCGDAFTSTFVAALILGKTPLEALEWAPINPMSVVEYIGAQQGLLTRSALEMWLAKKPEDYKAKKL